MADMTEKNEAVMQTEDSKKGLSGGATSYDFAVSKDGLAVHPQPTSDPLDPLNWSKVKKHTILAIVMFKYFMFTYITTTTVPSFPQLQEELGISYSQVNWTVAIPALGLALGPLFWSSLADIYGRRIIFISGTIIALASTIGAGVPGNYGRYMAARFFQGFGCAPAATVGMATVGDLFFEFERGQKLGLWVLALDSGLLVGPIIGGFIDLVSSAWIQWLTAIFFAVLLALELALMTETLYPRTQMLAQLPPASTDPEKVLNASSSANTSPSSSSAAAAVDLPRTSRLPFLNHRPVPGMKHPAPYSSALRFVLTAKYPAVVIAIVIYCFAWYWWILSIITMLPAAYIDYKPQIQGLLFFGLLLGTLFSEIFCSGALSDVICKRLAKRNGGVRVPEMRLWLAYPAALLSAIGLILWGVSIDQGYHWMVGQVAFFVFAAGIQMGNTAVAAYVVDCYPLQSMSVITFYSVLINLSAFIDPFFIAGWQARSGWTWCFAAQGIITFFVSVPVLGALHWFGPRVREWSGEMAWLNPEYDTL